MTYAATRRPRRTRIPRSSRPTSPGTVGRSWSVRPHRSCSCRAAPATSAPASGWPGRPGGHRRDGRPVRRGGCDRAPAAARSDEEAAAAARSSAPAGARSVPAWPTWSAIRGRRPATGSSRESWQSATRWSWRGVSTSSVGAASRRWRWARTSRSSVLPARCSSSTVCGSRPPRRSARRSSPRTTRTRCSTSRPGGLPRRRVRGGRRLALYPAGRGRANGGRGGPPAGAIAPRADLTQSGSVHRRGDDPAPTVHEVGLGFGRPLEQPIGDREGPADSGW